MPTGTYATDAGPAIELEADVLVLGGGPAGAWAALTAARAGSRVVLADKGFFGTSGATAPSNTGTWCVPPGPGRTAAIEKRVARTLGLADPACAEYVLDECYAGLLDLADQGYSFPRDPSDGSLYIANLRGPDYMRFMRKLVKGAGVKVLDHSPALELLSDADGVAGAAGLDRQKNRAWTVAANAVVLATGGCAFGERILGASGLTGDGYLMAAEAGAHLSGMEFSAQYGIAPAHTSLNKGLLYRWATFYDEHYGQLDLGPGDRSTGVARALLKGKVYARLDQADAQVRDWLRRGQPNCFLPYDRQGLNPFSDFFEITLRCEGTVRGLGGIRLADRGGATGVPGLYAAGDAASREPLNGAISGGGGPNASWAIASGRAAGRSAHLHGKLHHASGARGYISHLESIRKQAAQAAPRHGLAGGAAAHAPTTEAVLTSVRAAMLPVDRHFFRAEDPLAATQAEFNDLWRVTRDGFGGDLDVLRQREASALMASTRWSISAARLRRESRGIHRRTDATEVDPALARRIEISGVDTPELRLAPPENHVRQAA